MIGTPAYGGLVTSRYLTSAIATAQILQDKLRLQDSRQVPVAWCVIEGESLIHRARNNIVAKFMAAKPELSHLIFIDADIEWDAADLLRLIAHDQPVMCGIYPKKTEPAEFPFHPLLGEDGTAKRNPVTGAIKIANGPTGFLCVKREVFVQMREAYGHLKFACPKATEAEADWLYAYFDTYVEDGILWSEDYGFCRRWRALGGEIWCDPAIRLGHVGQRIYTGSVADLYEPSKPIPDGSERVADWLVPKGDPWFVPHIRDGADREIIAAALEHVTEFGCAVDVGAHIGTWTRPLAERFGRVMAIEPNDETFRLLLDNTDGLSNVRAMQSAAWDRSERLDLVNDGENSGECRTVPTVNGGSCAGVPLDSLGLERVGLIKVDVEGAELRVLTGARGTVERCRPVVVIEQAAGDSEAAAWLAGLGMREVARMPIASGHAVSNVVMAWPA